jgi:hypothetical protein
MTPSFVICIEFFTILFEGVFVLSNYAPVLPSPKADMCTQNTAQTSTKPECNLKVTCYTIPVQQRRPIAQQSQLSSKAQN